MTTTSGSASHSTWSALRIALRSLGRHPGLAFAFLVATLAKGALQGGLVWALREVLLALSKAGGAARDVLFLGSLAVLTVWLLRSAGVYAAQMFAARLAYRFLFDWIWRLLEKLLTLSVRFSDKSSRGSLVMT